MSTIIVEVIHLLHVNVFKIVVLNICSGNGFLQGTILSILSVFLLPVCRHSKILVPTEMATTVLFLMTSLLSSAQTPLYIFVGWRNYDYSHGYIQEKLRTKENQRGFISSGMKAKKCLVLLGSQKYSTCHSGYG